MLDNPRWPIFPGDRTDSLRPVNRETVANSILGPGSIWSGATLRHSVLQSDACVEPGASVDHCLIMDGARVKRGVRLRHAIVGSGSTVETDIGIRNNTGLADQRSAAGLGSLIVVPPRGREQAPAAV